MDNQGKKNTNTDANPNSVNTVMSINPYKQMTDLMMNAIIMKMSENFLTNMSELNFRVILNIFLIILIQECQGLITVFIDQVKKHVQNPKLIYDKIQYINSIFKHLLSFQLITDIFRMFSKKNRTTFAAFDDSKVEHIDADQGIYAYRFNRIRFNWKLNNKIWKMFLDYASTNPNFSYKSFDETDISTSNIKDSIYTFKMTNIKLPLDNSTLHINDSITYVTHDAGIVSTVEFYGNQTTGTYKRVTDFLSDRDLAKNIDKFIDDYIKFNDLTRYPIKNRSAYTPGTGGYTDIVQNINMHYLRVAEKFGMDPMRTLLEFNLFHYMDGSGLSPRFFTDSFLGFKVKANESLQTFAPGNIIYLSSLRTDIVAQYNHILTLYGKNPPTSVIIINLHNKSVDEVFQNISSQKATDRDSFNVKKGHLTVTLESEENKTHEEFKNEFDRFLEKMLEYHKEQKKDAVSVNVFELRLNHYIDMEEKPNPEYEKYIADKEKEQNKQLEKDLNKKDGEVEICEESDDEDDSNNNNNKKKKKHIKKKKGYSYGYDSDDDMMMHKGYHYNHMNHHYNSIHSIPSKTITKPVRKFTIEEKHINSISKTLDTLYLPREDIENLTYILDNFKNGGELLKRLELPHKLGILLYGEAGTGKSTTIKAISCFLGKNPYYIDLKNVKTNGELKTLFEHVNNNCETGGILVFEDIDVMTNIVNPRGTKQIEDTINGLSGTEDDKLTLSYFLNLLDGTLCTAGTTFIITTSHIQNLDKDLIRPGRVDLILETKRCDRYMVDTIFNQIMQRRLDASVLEKISEYQHKPVDIIFHVLRYVYNRKIDDELIMKPFLNKKDDLVYVE